MKKCLPSPNLEKRWSQAGKIESIDMEKQRVTRVINLRRERPNPRSFHGFISWLIRYVVAERGLELGGVSRCPTKLHISRHSWRCLSGSRVSTSASISIAKPLTRRDFPTPLGESVYTPVCIRLVRNFLIHPGSFPTTLMNDKSSNNWITLTYKPVNTDLSVIETRKFKWR